MTMIRYHLTGGSVVNVLPEHLDSFHARQAKLGPTGSQIVEAAGLKCVVAKFSRFYWKSRIVTLSPEIANGTGTVAEAVSWHEIAHSRQPRWWFWFLWFSPARWYIEWRAWMDCFGDV